MAWSLIFLIGTALWPAPRPAHAQTPATDVVIKFYQSRAARDPGDVVPWAKLGAVYVQKARESGDVTDHALAEQALARVLERRPDASTAAGVTTLLAVVQLARHDFQEARRSAQRAVASGSAGLFATRSSGTRRSSWGTTRAPMRPTRSSSA